METLEWEDGFENFDLTVIKVPGDGSCFFHAVCRAFYIPYITETFNGVYTPKREIVSSLRKSLAEKLEEKNPSGVILYDRLSRGNLRERSKETPDNSLENMKKIIADYDNWVGLEVLELVSEILEKDIYILDKKTRDLYKTADRELLYKERESIVILYSNNHFDCIGVANGSQVNTFFKKDNPFISFLRKRL